MASVHTTMRPLLLMLGDYTNLNLNRIQVIASLTQLFPNTFNEKLCEQLLVSQLISSFLNCIRTCQFAVDIFIVIIIL